MARDRFGPYVIHWDRNTETLTITGDENTRASIRSSAHNDVPVVITVSQFSE